MDFLKRKRNTFKVTLDGKEHQVEVTKTTTCDDVIRQLFESTGRDCKDVGKFSVFKLSSGKVKILEKDARIKTGASRFFWKTSTSVFVIKRRQPYELDGTPKNSKPESEVTSRQQNVDLGETFCESPSVPTDLRDLEEHMKMKRLTARRCSLPAISRLPNDDDDVDDCVFNTRRTTVSRSTMQLSGGTDDENDDFISRVNVKETFGLQVGPYERWIQEQESGRCQSPILSRRRSSILSSNVSQNTTLVIKRALKTRSKLKSSSDIDEVKLISFPSSSSTPTSCVSSRVPTVPSTTHQHESSDKSTVPKGCLFKIRLNGDGKEMDRVTEGGPLHSTPVTANQCLPRTSSTGLPGEKNFNRFEGKKILLRRFLHNFDTTKMEFHQSPNAGKYEAKTSSSQEQIVHQPLDTGFMADDLDEGISFEHDIASQQDSEEDVFAAVNESLERMINTVLYEGDSDEGLSSLEDDSKNQEVAIFV